jgi:hypothetical protein
MSIRVKTALIIVATLLLGGLVGAFTTSRVMDQRMERLNRLRSPDGFAERMEQVIVPRNAEQQARIRVVLERTSDRFDALHRSYRSQRGATMDSMRTELAPLLAPDQQDRLDAWFEALRARHARGPDSDKDRSRDRGVDKRSLTD